MICFRACLCAVSNRQCQHGEERSLQIMNQCKSGCNAPGRREFGMKENQLVKVIVENGITYHLAENGCYYPQLSLEQRPDYVVGK